MPTKVKDPAGLEKRREQNRLAQKRFRQKHRRQKDSGQSQSQGQPHHVADQEIETETEIEREPSDDDTSTLANLVSIPDPSPSIWSLSSYDHVIHNSVIDPALIDMDMDMDLHDVSGLELDDFAQAALPRTASSSSRMSTLTWGQTEKTLVPSSSSNAEDDSLSLSSNSPPDNYWQSPLHIAVQKGNAKIVQLLLQHKADCNQRDGNGLTALMHAVIHGHDDIAHLLLLNGACTSIVNSQHQSVLHFAVLHCRDRLLKKLLQHSKGDGTVINGYTTDGQTPLHMAIATGFEIAVELLLEYGADAQSKARI